MAIQIRFIDSLTIRLYCRNGTWIVEIRDRSDTVLSCTEFSSLATARKAFRSELA
jgi:hypothetical protein